MRGGVGVTGSGTAAPEAGAVSTGSGMTGSAGWLGRSTARSSGRFVDRLGAAGSGVAALRGSRPTGSAGASATGSAGVSATGSAGGVSATGARIRHRRRRVHLDRRDQVAGVDGNIGDVDGELRGGGAGDEYGEEAEGQREEEDPEGPRWHWEWLA